MKVRTIEIEATAKELKASNSFADALSNQLRNLFKPIRYNFAEAEEDADEEDAICD